MYFISGGIQMKYWARMCLTVKCIKRNRFRGIT